MRLATAVGLLVGAATAWLAGLIAHLTVPTSATPARVICVFGGMLAAAGLAVNAAPARGATRFTVRGGAFRVGPRRRSRLFSVGVVLLSLLSAGVLAEPAAAGGPAVALGPLGWALLAGAAATGMIHLTALSTNRPSLVLTRDGVQVATTVRRRTVPWAAMRPGTPRLEAHGDWLLGLTVDQPAPGRVWLPVRHLDVDPEFLVAALRYHVDDPHSRDAIGTEAGHRALLADVLGPPAAGLESIGAQPQRDPRDLDHDRGGRRVAPRREVGPLGPVADGAARLADRPGEPVGRRDLG
ncbi:hypothetical protein GCM10009682_22470 [Luedemannella flava]|uniref:PH domain-containing protein n=1 Tax=Luedemannella flava TaxID=349316 RepID=A0ABP4Y0Z1_9ACTN